MPSHRGHDKRDPEQPDDDNVPNSMPEDVAVDVGTSCAEVLTDEEDSYRLVLEHDEHLARIRGYTDFHDGLAQLKRAAAAAAAANDRGGNDRGSRSPPPPLPSEQRADSVESLKRSGDGSAAQEQELERSPTFSPTEVETRHLASRLKAENTRLAADLQASQETVQRLHAALYEARAAVKRSSRLRGEDVTAGVAAEGNEVAGVDIDVDVNGTPPAAQGLVVPVVPQRRPPLHPSLVSPASLSSLSKSTTPARASTASSSRATGERTIAATAAGAAPPPATVDMSSSENTPAAPRVPSPAPLDFSSRAHSPHLSSASRQGSVSRGGGRGGCDSVSGGRLFRTAGAEAKTFDLAEFFWALRVAPPPSTLHAKCARGGDGADHCHAAASAAASLSAGGVYGSVAGSPTSAAALASAGSTDQVLLLPGHTQRLHGGSGYGHLQGREETEEEAALACESAWVDSTYYCYNIMDELSSLRVVPSPDDVAAEPCSSDAAMLSPLATEEEMTRHLLNRSLVSASPHPSSPVAQHSPPSVPPRENTGVEGMMAMGLIDGGSPGNSFFSAPAPAAGRRYRLPYLQRLWVTAVLRHLLLFLLVILACTLVFVPGIVIGTVNVFEAAKDEDFYAMRNRYGRSALLVVARLVACTMTFLVVFGVACVHGGRQQRHHQHQQGRVTSKQDLEQESSTGSGAAPLDAMEDSTAGALAGPATAAAAPQPTRPSLLRGSVLSALTSVGTLVHVALCAGAALMFLGVVLLREGCRSTSLPLALLGEASHGAGEAMLLGGLGIVISAEVGVAAGVSVSLQIMMLSWLIVNAFGSFLFPKLGYYVYTTAALVDALVGASVTLGAFVLGIVLLCPRDLIERAVRANARDISPRKLWAAAQHDVSLCFLLRTITVGLLTAAVVLLMTCGKAVFIPTEAVAATVAESAKTRELMGTGTVKTGTTGELLPGQRERWAKHQDHALVLLFTYALVAMPFCFIPRLASLINRLCPVPLLTTLLCLVWMISAGASWAPILGLDALIASTPTTTRAGAQSSTRDSTAAMVLPAAPSWLTGVWLWLAERHFLNPRVDLCALLTGLVYTVAVSSLLRSIANAGVQLPVMHPLRWRMAFHRRDRRAAARASAAGGVTSESSPLLSTRWRLRGQAQPSADVAAAEAERPSEVAAAPPAEESSATAAYAEELQRCARMQLRGGPAVMTVLGCTLLMVLLLTSMAVMIIAASLLTNRDEAPLFVARLVPTVMLDEHLVVKSITVCVLMLAMLVQWVEVIHRVCSCLCCGC